jgi:hypothetical protein
MTDPHPRRPHPAARAEDRPGGRPALRLRRNLPGRVDPWRIRCAPMPGRAHPPPGVVLLEYRITAPAPAGLRTLLQGIWQSSRRASACMGTACRARCAYNWYVSQRERPAAGRGSQPEYGPYSFELQPAAKSPFGVPADPIITFSKQQAATPPVERQRAGVFQHPHLHPTTVVIAEGIHTAVPQGRADPFALPVGVHVQCC